MARVVAAPNTFKGSLSAAEAASAMARGLRCADPGLEITELPLSDGGEGMVETLVAASGGHVAHAMVTDAIGRPIQAPYGVLADGRTMVVELSSAAGLVHVPTDRRNPLVTTTRGVGELILAAYRAHPFKTLILALGGSATVDAGVGLLQALGVRFLDGKGEELPPGGGALRELSSVDTAAMHPLVREVDIELAVDVTNPLLGSRGAASVYAPQKGASPADVRVLEAALTRLADVLEPAFGVRLRDLPGTGSAGGVPAGLVAIAKATMRPGFELVAEAVGLDAHMRGAQMVLTGEGQLDLQSFEGKVVGRLAEHCRRLGIPLVAIAGNLTPEGEEEFARMGGAAFPLVSGPVTSEEAMREAAVLLERAAGRVLALRKAFNWEPPQHAVPSPLGSGRPLE